MTEEFPKWLETQIKEIPFDLIYKNILVGEYIPSDIVDMMQLTMYHLELNQKLNPMLIGCFSFYLDILYGCHKQRKELTRNELLYVVYRCKHELDKCEHKSPNNPHGMYI